MAFGNGLDYEKWKTLFGSQPQNIGRLMDRLSPETPQTRRAFSQAMPKSSSPLPSPERPPGYTTPVKSTFDPTPYTQMPPVEPYYPPSATNPLDPLLHGRRPEGVTYYPLDADSPWLSENQTDLNSQRDVAMLDAMNAERADLLASLQTPIQPPVPNNILGPGATAPRPFPTPAPVPNNILGPGATAPRPKPVRPPEPDDWV